MCTLKHNRIIKIKSNPEWEFDVDQLLAERAGGKETAGRSLRLLSGAVRSLSPPSRPVCRPSWNGLLAVDQKPPRTVNQALFKCGR